MVGGGLTGFAAHPQRSSDTQTTLRILELYNCSKEPEPCMYAHFSKGLAP